MSDISITGLFNNLLSTGFSTTDGINELIDNSTGANATKIVIDLNLETQHLIYSDNGHGMTKPALKKAFIFSETSDPSVSKDGRFGVGLKYALAQLTRLQYPATVISKSDIIDERGDQETSEVIIDFPEIIRTNFYYNHPSDLSVRKLPLWNKYSVDIDKGTLFMLECDYSIFTSLIQIICPTVRPFEQIVTLYPYNLGWTYCNRIKQGLSIEFHNTNEGTDKLRVIPVDPLEWDKTCDANKKITLLQVYKLTDSDSIRILFTEPYGKSKGKRGYVIKKNEKLESFLVSDTAPDGFELLCEMEHKSCYNTWEEWINFQTYIFEHYGIAVPSTNGNRPSPKPYTHMGGRYWTRNGKRIMRTTIPSVTTGDKSKRDYYIDSRHELSFDARMDDFIKVIINKSKLDEDHICDAIRMTTKHLEKGFVSEMYAKYYMPPAVEHPVPDINAIHRPPMPDINAIHRPDINATHMPDTDDVAQLGEILDASVIAGIETPGMSSASGGEIIGTRVKHVRSSQHVIVCVNDGLRMLERCYNSKHSISGFEELVNEMLHSYQSGTTKDDAVVWIRFMGLNQKYEMLKYVIEKKYPMRHLPDDHTELLAGSMMFRYYSLAFP